ncbi:Tenascin-R [Holothuria leucospilota]|uniref:Tenascin-R n=1 Tax=Holothuria leucospilota TaxID=206669 RepID=A0A9Q0YK80_HOLLE|nr:Tenascin-R [Holothuria leucospilota]
MKCLKLSFGITIAFLALHVNRVYSQCTGSWKYMERTSSDKNHMLENHLVRNVTGIRSALECLSVCVKYGTICESINFSEKLQECHVNGDTKSGSPGDFVSDSRFDYYAPGSSHWMDSQTHACSDADACYNSADCTEYCHPPWYRCGCAVDFTGEQCTLSTHYDGVASSCKAYLDAGHTTSGVLQIDPDGQGQFDVYCDMDTDGGGWTLFQPLLQPSHVECRVRYHHDRAYFLRSLVLQKRFDGSVDFYRSWSDYVNGFGSVSGEYWLGLEKLYRMASSTKTLRVDLTDWNWSSYYAQYNFYIHNSGDRYRGYFSSYSGTAGDSLSYHNGYRFSTYDYDSDNYGGNCASSYHGAWWYNACHHSNLNGKYVNGGSTSENAVGAVWYHLHGHNYALMLIEMKIR